ncbi:unnamed protein product [Hapterophycus canaliculatus]
MVRRVLQTMCFCQFWLLSLSRDSGKITIKRQFERKTINHPWKITQSTATPSHQGISARKTIDVCGCQTASPLRSPFNSNFPNWFLFSAKNSTKAISVTFFGTENV